MKIALLGYGRMGRIIEKLAENGGHEIVYKTSDPADSELLKKADVAIEFSIAEAAFENLKICFENQIPVVCGTTGWLDQYDEAVQLCKEKNGTFLYASNFSIGVNLFFELNKNLARLMKNFGEYQLTIDEIHHTGKRDKPSGTAISLAEDIINNSAKTGWQLTEGNTKTDNEHIIPVRAHRAEDVKGTHIIEYKSAIDVIEIRHTAYSREGFAGGAILAAEFILRKKGVFSMKEVLKDLI